MSEATFSNILDKELVWREREMALAKFQLHRAIGDDLGFLYAYRCFVTINYAHFEGFTKRILEQTLNELISSGVEHTECGSAMQKNLFGPYARKIVDKISNAELIEYIFHSSKFAEILKFPKPEEAFDISSMTYANFERAISCVGLDARGFDTYKTIINKLTYLRHECAHGERISWEQTKNYRSISIDMFYLQDKIHDVMHELAIKALERITSIIFQI